MERRWRRLAKWGFLLGLVFLTLPAALTLPLLLLLIKLRLVPEAAAEGWLQWVVDRVTGGIATSQRRLIRRQIRGLSREEVEARRAEFEEHLTTLAQQGGRPDAFAETLRLNRALEEAEMARTGVYRP